MNSRNTLVLGITVLAWLVTPAHAQVALHVFQPGERATAADFNANFNNLKLAVEAAERRNVELQNRIRNLEASLSNVRALNGVLSIEGVNGVRTVRLTGVNLQVVNGLSRTETINGAGNIIIGYDEPNSFTTKPICSQARAFNGALIADEAGCLAAGGVFSTQHKSGSHNLVLGTQNGYSSFGGMVGGRFNYINEIFASVLGGVDNRASGRFSAIVSGQGHLTQESGATVLGGIGNQALSRNSSITGGVGNVATGESSSITGGERNTASGRISTAVGGLLNSASGQGATVTGGRNNVASGTHSNIAGGN
jgi:trimeric autotransporter adhesin